MKKSFALFVTIILVYIFGAIGLTTIENKLISSNMDSFKYHYIQSKLHIDTVEQYIIKYKMKPKYNPKNYDIRVYKENNTSYDIFVKSLNQEYINLHKKVVLK